MCIILLEEVHTLKNATNMLTKQITSDKLKHCLNQSYSPYLSGYECDQVNLRSSLTLDNMEGLI